jgi:hypothetical protein
MIGGVEGCFECVEEASIEDGVVRIVHVHYIESYVLGSRIAKATDRYGAYWLNSFAIETIH